MELRLRIFQLILEPFEYPSGFFQFLLIWLVGAGRADPPIALQFLSSAFLALHDSSLWGAFAPQMITSGDSCP